MKKVLLIDDDKDFLEQMQQIIESQLSVDVTTILNPVDAISDYTVGEFDLIIVDYMMSTMNGLELVNIIRKIDPYVRISMLTGIESDDLELEALNGTVQRFMNKGQRKDILVKYIANDLDGVKDNHPQDLLEKKLVSYKEGIQVSLKDREVFQDDKCVELTRKEFELLVFFLLHKDQVIPRETMIKKIWGDDSALIDYRTVDSHVKNLRRKMSIQSIQSIRSVGYKWNELY